MECRALSQSTDADSSQGSDNQQNSLHHLQPSFFGLDRLFGGNTPNPQDRISSEDE
jgi:hypothetical protein